MTTPQPTQPPTQPSPRFTQELEFVLSLANPAYLQYLAVTLPHIFNPTTPPSAATAASKSTSASTTTTNNTNNSNSDAAKFARYLAYLHKYWSTPAYSQYLTHPAATLRHLELLQSEQFRRDLIRPDLLPRLAEGYGDAQGLEGLIALDGEEGKVGGEGVGGGGGSENDGDEVKGNGVGGT